jgi:hypothetical protein
VDLDLAADRALLVVEIAVVLGEASVCVLGKECVAGVAIIM